MHKNICFRSLILLLSVTACSPAASLIGSQVTVTLNYPALGDVSSIPSTKTVNGGIEFPAGSLTPIPGADLIPVNITVGASTIDLTYPGSAVAPAGSFDGYIFTFAGAPTITGAILDSASTFTPSQVIVGFGTNEVTVNLPQPTSCRAEKILRQIPEPK